jgi:hypothetical protein
MRNDRYHRGCGRVDASRLLAVLASLSLAAACAGSTAYERGERVAPGASARDLAGAGFRSWLARNDPTAAAGRFSEALRQDSGDPWARLGAALLARRSLDDAGEAAELVALVRAAPDHPLAGVAAARLGELAEISPPLAQLAEDGLAAVQPRARGLTALRLRAVRAAAAWSRGDLDRAAALRAEGGAVTSWTAMGPFGGLHALDFEVRFPPEEGRIVAGLPGPGGPAAAAPRALPSPDGILALDPEAARGDPWYLAADASLARGGSYLLAIGTEASVRAWVDGAPALERRAWSGFPALAQVAPLTLSAGTHRILLKVARGGGRAELAVLLARADGAPSDAVFSAPAAGSTGPRAVAGGLPAPVNLARDLSRALEQEMGPEVARLVAAGDVIGSDRETAKVLLEEALARAPRSAALLAARSAAEREDPTVPERIARARAEGDLDRALALDGADAASRLERADLARVGSRLDEAAALLDALEPAAASQPRALVARARVAQARGMSASAERFADEARRRGGNCAALEIAYELSSQRDAIAREDELAGALVRCPGGRGRLLQHRRRRGDLAGALALAGEAVRAAPARLDARLLRAELRAAAGDPRGGADDLAELSRLWPSDARIEKRRAELLDAAGDAAAARRARERALLLDGGDLALRRAVALEEGKEPLEDLADDGLQAIAAYRAAKPGFVTSSVTVLDSGAVEVHPDGSQTERIHTVIEARDQAAVDHVGEIMVPEGAQLLLARTVKTDGRVLEPEEPIGDKRTLSLTGLEPGDFAEWEWLRAVPARGPELPGFSGEAFYLRGDSPLWRSSYQARAPAGTGMEVDAHRMPAPERRIEGGGDCGGIGGGAPDVKVGEAGGRSCAGGAAAGGREVIRVLRERVPPLAPEPHAPSEPELVPFVQIGAGAGRDELVRALADRALMSFRPTSDVVAFAGEIAASVPSGERAGEALVRAAYRKVNEAVLGQGGGLSEGAGSILSRRRGSRTVLLKAVLDVLGVRARIALVRGFGKDPAPYRFPEPSLYGHAVLRVEHGGRVAWLDPSVRGTPYGVLAPDFSGAEALVLPAPGEAVQVTTTPADDRADRRSVTVKVVLEGDGGASVEGTDQYRGFEAAGLRSALEQMDAQSLRQALERALAGSFGSVQLTALEVEGEKDIDRPLVLHWRAGARRWARLEEGRVVVDTPILPARVGARFLQRATRETPILVAADERATLTLEVVPPPGFVPEPAAPSDIASRYGRYRRTETSERGRLLRKEEYDLERGRIAPPEVAAFSGFASSVDGAQESPMVFTRSTRGDAGPRGQPAKQAKP